MVPCYDKTLKHFKILSNNYILARKRGLTLGLQLLERCLPLVVYESETGGDGVVVVVAVESPAGALAGAAVAGDAVVRSEGAVVGMYVVSVKQRPVKAKFHYAS